MNTDTEIDVERSARQVRDAIEDTLRQSYGRITEVEPSLRRVVAAGLARALRDAYGVGKKPLVIGIAPRAGGTGGTAPWVSGPSAERLANLLGTTVEGLAGRVDLMNVHDFPEYDRREVHREMTREFRGRPFVVVVGAEAAAALGLGGMKFLEPEEVRRVAVVVIPHTSGRCRWWNSAGNRRRAEDFFNGLMTGNRRARG